MHATTSVSNNTKIIIKLPDLVTNYSRTLKHQYKHFLIKTHEFDNIRDSPEAKFTIQIYFCTPTVQLLLLCLRTVQIT